MSHHHLPLSHIKILDLTTLYPGPLLTLLLHDLGATIIKLESPSAPDFLRGVERVSFEALNRGKLGVALDLKRMNAVGEAPLVGKQEELRQESQNPSKNDSTAQKFDKKWLHEWLASFDVVVDSHRPGSLEKQLQVANMDELRRLFPRLVVVRLSAFGQEGLEHLKYVPAHDMNALARAGVLNMSHPRHQISPLPVQIVDVLIAYSACAQAVAAIHKREIYGEASVIDVSMYDAAISTMIMPYSEMLSSTRKDLDRTEGKDLLCGSVPCYNIYQTKEGLLSVGCIEPHFWLQFLKVLNLQHLSGEATNITSLDKVKAAIEDKLRTKTAEEWEQIFMLKLLLPITKLRNLKQDQELLEREMESRRMIFTTRYGARVVRPCLDYVSFLKSPTEAESAPTIGQHNNILKSKL